MIEPTGRIATTCAVNDLTTIGDYRAALVPYRRELMGLVTESTFNRYWLVDDPVKEGYQVHLANPATIRQ